MIGCVDVRSYSATDIVLYLLIIGVNHTAVLDLPPPDFGVGSSVSCPSCISIKKQLFSQLEQDMVGHISMLSTPLYLLLLGIDKICIALLFIIIALSG